MHESFEENKTIANGRAEEFATKKEGSLRESFDIVVSRAGANAICELAALNKPNVLIPLSAKSSRGDQIINARSFEQQGFSMVIDNDELDEDILGETIYELYNTREKYVEAMCNSNLHSATDTIIRIIKEEMNK